MKVILAKTAGFCMGVKRALELVLKAINQNQGAESSLAWLLSLMALQKLYADEILKQPTSPKNDR